MSALDQDIAILGAVRPLSLLEREALRLLAFAADRRHLRTGEILFRQDDPSTGAAVVLEGLIALKAGEDEEKTAERGALIGELALLIPTTHPAQATARRPSQLMMITRALFKRVLAEFPDSAVAIHRAYAGELRGLIAGADQVRRQLDALG